MLPHRSQFSVWTGAAALVIVALLAFLAGWRLPATHSILSAPSRGTESPATSSKLPSAAHLVPIALTARTEFADMDQLPIHPEFRVTSLGSIGQDGDAAGINDKGVVVGSCARPHGNEAFLWRNGRFKFLGAFSACGVNDHGMVAGFKQIAGGRERPVLRLGARSLSLELPAGSDVYAYAINDRDEVIGNALAGPNLISHAFVWTGHRPWPLWARPGVLGSQANGINDKGEIVGSATSAGGRQHACLWQRGRMEDLGSAAAGYDSQAQAVNDRGQIVGTASIPAEAGGVATHAVVWQQGRMADLGALPGWPNSHGSAINDRGQVVGSIERQSSAGKLGRSHAFLWRHSRMVDLNREIPPGSGWVLEEATAINDHGQIVGSGIYKGKRRAFLLSPLMGSSNTSVLARLPTSRPTYKAPAKPPVMHVAATPAARLTRPHHANRARLARLMRPPAIKSKSLHAVRLAAYQKIVRVHQAVFEQKHLRTVREARRWGPPPIPIGFQGVVVSKTERPYTYQVQDGNISRNIYFGPNARPRTGDEIRVRGVLRQDGTVAAASVAHLGYHHLVVRVSQP